MAKEPNLLYYLLIAGGTIIRFIPFPKGISAMWNANSLIQVWNRIAVSISYYDKVTLRALPTSLTYENQIVSVRFGKHLSAVFVAPSILITWCFEKFVSGYRNGAQLV